MQSVGYYSYRMHRSSCEFLKTFHGMAESVCSLTVVPTILITEALVFLYIVVIASNVLLR